MVLGGNGDGSSLSREGGSIVIGRGDTSWGRKWRSWGEAV